MYYIYHISGVKIGCSTQPNQRVKAQNYNAFEIIEEHADIYLASDREQELQKQYGYKVDDCPYWKSYEQNTLRRNKLSEDTKRNAGKKAGDMNVKSGWIKEFQQRSVLARTGTKHSEEAKMKMRLARLGKRNKPTVGVLVYDKENNLVNKFNSITEAATTMSLHSANISSVISGKLKTTGGYKFIKA